MFAACQATQSAPALPGHSCQDPEAGLGAACLSVHPSAAAAAATAAGPSVWHASWPEQFSQRCRGKPSPVAPDNVTRATGAVEAREVHTAPELSRPLPGRTPPERPLRREIAPQWEGPDTAWHGMGEPRHCALDGHCPVLLLLSLSLY